MVNGEKQALNYGILRIVWKWAGMYLLSLVIATLGVWYAAKVFADIIIAPIAGNPETIRILTQPYYGLQILFAFATGYVSRARWRGSYGSYVWVITAGYLLLGIIEYTHSGFLMKDALSHFFGPYCLPYCQDQYARTVPFYTTTFYSLGCLARKWTHSLDKSEGIVSIEGDVKQNTSPPE